RTSRGFFPDRADLCRTGRTAAGIATGPLDLDHVGAQVAEDLAAEKSKLVGKIENAKGGEEALIFISDSHAVRENYSKKRAGDAALPFLFLSLVPQALPCLSSRARERMHPALHARLGVLDVLVAEPFLEIDLVDRINRPHEVA